MASCRDQKSSSLKGVSAALLIAVIFATMHAAAAATADNPNPAHPDETAKLIVAVGALLIALILGFFITRDCERFKQEEFYDGWTERIEEALTKALETDNFSDAWVGTAARAKCEAILKRARAIEEKEAERQVWAREEEAEYRQIAAFAASRHGLDEEEVVQLLREAHKLPYRLLQEAKNIAVGGS